MITIVCWLWKNSKLSYTYKPEYVDVLTSMFKRHLTIPHQIVCITDEPASSFTSNVIILPTPDEARKLNDLQTPEGNGFPTCYRRLWLFSEQARVLGSRIFLTDLDIVLVNNVDSVFNKNSDFVGWQAPGGSNSWGSNFFVGCLWQLRTGSRTQVWDDFVKDPKKAISDARGAGFRGSDQAWISYKLFKKEEKFKHEDGIYLFNRYDGKNPANAKIIQFNGNHKPWHSSVSWVKDNWK